jgi:hypothetical protein
MKQTIAFGIDYRFFTMGVSKYDEKTFAGREGKRD